MHTPAHSLQFITSIYICYGYVGEEEWKWVGGGELVTVECREMGQEAAKKGYRERHRREKGIRGGQGRKERVGVLAFF